MRYRILSTALALSAFGLLTTASAFEVSRAKTEAAVWTAATGARFVKLNFSAELTNAGLPDLASQRVVAGWQEVGGVEPVPFRVLIPAGCFVGRLSFRVGDFRGCGVQVLFGGGGRLPSALVIVDFEARFVPRDDGTARLAVEASVIPTDGGHSILGALGGAAVEVALGSESARSLPVGIETVSGIEPTPF